MEIAAAAPDQRRDRVKRRDGRRSGCATAGGSQRCRAAEMTLICRPQHVDLGRDEPLRIGRRQRARHRRPRERQPSARRVSCHRRARQGSDPDAAGRGVSTVVMTRYGGGSRQRTAASPKARYSS